TARREPAPQQQPGRAREAVVAWSYFPIGPGAWPSCSITSPYGQPQPAGSAEAGGVIIGPFRRGRRRRPSWEGPAGRGAAIKTLLRKEADVTAPAKSSSGEAQANRLERVYEEVAKLLREPGVASHLRTAPGEREWSAMQALGHMTEMIPYW